MTVKHFTELLAENRKTLAIDTNVISELTKLKYFITKLEDANWAKRSKSAAKKISGMTEEERKMMLMFPDEKIFFLQYKKQHPDNPWGYFKEYQKSIQHGYKVSGELH